MSSPISLFGLRLLVLEDEAVIALGLKMMLSDLGGHVVAMAGSVSRALALLGDATLEIDAAVLDVNLGTEPSYPVAELLAARGIPFIFSTGYGATSILPKFSHVPTVTKPFNERSVEAALLTVLAKGSAGGPA
jgi:CheY-like chemotaxis protein